MDGKASFWNPKADFKTWEKMKTVYFELEEEEEPILVAFDRAAEGWNRAELG